MFLGAWSPNENLSGSVLQPRTSYTSHGRPEFSENTYQDDHTASFSSQVITYDGNQRPQCIPAATQYIRPPEYNNRFTRMNLEKDAIVRTSNGFVDFFNSNAFHMLKEAWEKVIIPRKRFEGTPQARKTLVEDRSPTSIQPLSNSNLECFAELEESRPVNVDTITKEEREPLDPKSSPTPFSEKENIQQKSVGGENEVMHNSPVLTKSMENQGGRARRKFADPPGTYDCHFKDRCRSYMVKRQCFNRNCQYLHTLPKDDDILCKSFETGFCPKTKAECWFKHNENKNVVVKRCSEYLATRWCSKRSYCNYLHRLPKEDNIVCSYFLAGSCKYGKYECLYLHQKEEKKKEETAVVAEKDEDTCGKGTESRCNAVLPKDDDILCKRFQAGDCLESAESCRFKHGETSETSEKNLDARVETSEGNSDTHNARESFLIVVHPIENSQDDRVSSKTIATPPTNVNSGGSRAEGKHVGEIPKSNAVKITGSVSPNQSEIPGLAKDPPPKQQSINNNGKPLSKVGKINIVKDCGQSQIHGSQEETNKPKSVVPVKNPSLVKSLEESRNVMNSHDSECSQSSSPVQAERKLHDAPPRVERLNEQSKAAPVEHHDMNSQNGKQPAESATSPWIVASQNLESESQVIQASAQPTVIEGGQSCQSTDTGTEEAISKPEPSVSNADALTLKHREEPGNDSLKLDDKCSHVEPIKGKSEGVSESAEQLSTHTSTEDSLPGKQSIERKQKSVGAPVQSSPTIRPLKELPTGASSQDDSSSRSVKPLQTNRDPAEVSCGNETPGSSPISHLPRKSKSGGPVIKDKCKSKSPGTKRDRSPGLSDSTEEPLKNEDIQQERKKYTAAVENTTDMEHVKGKQHIKCKQKSIQFPVQLSMKDVESPESCYPVTDTPILKSPKQGQIDRKSHDNRCFQSVKPLQANKDPAEVGLGSETSGSSPITCLTDNEVRRCKLVDAGQENMTDIGHVKGQQYLECEQNSVQPPAQHFAVKLRRFKVTETGQENMTDTRYVKEQQYLECKQNSAQSPAQPLGIKVAELHCADNEANNNQLEDQIDLKSRDKQTSQRIKSLQANKDPAEVGLGNESCRSSPSTCLTDDEGEVNKCKEKTKSKISKEKAEGTEYRFRAESKKAEFKRCDEKGKSKKLQRKGTSHSGICPTNTAGMLDKSKVPLFVREKYTSKRPGTTSNTAHITPCKKSQRQTLFGSSSGSDSTDELSESDDIQHKRKKLSVAQENEIDIEQERVDDEVERKVKRRNGGSSSLLTHRNAPAFKKRKHQPCEEDYLSSTMRECRPEKSLKPAYYVKDDGSGFPISSATTREDLFCVIGRIVGFQGIPREEDFSELYSEFARLYEQLTQWKLLKSEKSDKFVVLEANVRILIASIYNDEEGALRMKESLVEHWRREPDLKAFKKRMELREQSLVH